MISLHGYPATDYNVNPIGVKVGNLYTRVGSIYQVEFNIPVSNNLERPGVVKYRNISTLAGVSGSALKMMAVKEKGCAEKSVIQPIISKDVEWIQNELPVFAVHRSYDPNSNCNTACLLTPQKIAWMKKVICDDGFVVQFKQKEPKIDNNSDLLDFYHIKNDYSIPYETYKNLIDEMGI